MNTGDAECTKWQGGWGWGEKGDQGIPGLEVQEIGKTDPER